MNKRDLLSTFLLGVVCLLGAISNASLVIWTIRPELPTAVILYIAGLIAAALIAWAWFKRVNETDTEAIETALDMIPERDAEIERLRNERDKANTRRDAELYRLGAWESLLHTAADKLSVDREGLTMVGVLDYIVIACEEARQERDAEKARADDEVEYVAKIWVDLDAATDHVNYLLKECRRLRSLLGQVDYDPQSCPCVVCEADRWLTQHKPEQGEE